MVKPYMITDIKNYEHLIRSECTVEELYTQGTSSPRTYLDFAIADLADSISQRILVNALSNAKRALHFQTELIAGAFGYNSSLSRKNRSYPAKLKFCTRCGIVGPRILRKVNQIRNAMEHDYYIPTQSETEDFVDIVELFLAATDRFIRSFPTSLGLRSDDDVPELGPHYLYLTINNKPHTGLLDISIKQLKISMDELHILAAEHKKILEDEIIDKEKRTGIKTKFIGGVESAAYTYVAKENYETTNFKIKASDEDTYFSWISFLIDRYE